MGFKDYYKILGISEDANYQEIKSAYRNLVKKSHFDSHAQENLNEKEIKELNKKLIEVREAYDVLSNAEKRKNYDALCLCYQFLKDYEEEQNIDKTSSLDEKEENSKKTLKEYYQEVKKDEEKFSFSKRHRSVERKYRTVFSEQDKNKNLKDRMSFSLGKGTVHVFHEMFYQLSKIKSSFKEPFPKFVIRNRYLLSTLGTAMFLCGFSNNNSLEKNIRDCETIIEDADFNKKTEEDTYLNDYLTMNRVHKIKKGDTLYSLATLNGIKLDKVRKLNNLENDKIIKGHSIILPYEINSQDFKYYTQAINIKDRSIYEIAKEYETDLKTICSLNKDAIEEINNVYYIMSDTIYVPNFISLKELSQLKSQEIINRLN